MLNGSSKTHSTYSKSKQPKRLAPKSFQVQLKVEKMSAFVIRWCQKLGDMSAEFLVVALALPGDRCRRHL
jgi:hypothetical protein